MLPMGIAFRIEESSSVRLLWEVLEGMDFSTLEKAPCAQNTAASVREMTAILLFGAMNRIYSSRRLEDACRHDIRYMWLLDGRDAPDHSTIARFRHKKLPILIESLFGQQMAQLAQMGEIDYETNFVDGTKLEANANRYSFVWKKSVEKHLARLKEKASQALGIPASVAALYAAAAKKRKEMTELGIVSVSGKGRYKSTQQRRAEELETMAAKWEEYERHLGIMGEGRNSYSKTDPDATFMRMKDDHMRNGQLKAAYNLQIAVNSEYIVGYGAFDERNDMATFIPFLAALEKLHARRYKSVTADAGYESHENYAYLDACEQQSFIKPSNYERSKKKSNWVGRAEDMQYEPDSDSFLCKAAKRLQHIGSRTRKSKTGYESVSDIYRCTECKACALRARCSKSENEEEKTLQVDWAFARYRQKSLENITSEKGILFRVNRSIQVEGAFGVIKQDWGFRRFLTRGKQNILTEIGILAFAFNISKLHAKIQNNRTGSQLFEVNVA